MQCGTFVQLNNDFLLYAAYLICLDYFLNVSGDIHKNRNYKYGKNGG